MNAIPKGQMEAARALGQSCWQAFSRVLLPQAARVLAPALVSEAASLVKNTSLAVAVGVAELTYSYKYIDNFQFRGIEALTAVTALYCRWGRSSAGGGKWVGYRTSRHAPAARLDRALVAD